MSAYSRHPDLAFEAALCLRNRENQLSAAIEGGLPPTLRALYDEPAFMKEYPFSQDVLAGLESASVRPITPVYQNVSIAVSHTLSPPSGIEPESSVNTIREQIDDALRSEGVIP